VYSSCWFALVAKKLFPNLRGDSLFKKAHELLFDFEAEDFKEFSRTAIIPRCSNAKKEYLKQHPGVELISKMEKILVWLEKVSEGELSAIQLFVENDAKSHDSADYKYDEFYGNDDLLGKHILNVIQAINHMLF
jgi:hypothetical protein